MEKSLFFIGITPPHPIEEEIHRLKTQLCQKYKTKGSLRSKAHITLQMPFTLPSKKEKQLINDLTKLLNNKTPFEVLLNGYGKFEPRVVYVNVQGNDNLSAIHQAFAKHMRNYQIFNSTHKNNGFNPHITVAFRDLKKPVFYEIWEQLKNEPFSRSFLADRITLFKHNGKDWDSYKEVLMQG